VAEEVERGFGFELTEGQRQALADVERDMVWRKRPMDRLVLGDVGFGKTEIAVRAVHRAVANGRQAAVLAPTTILAAQHFARLRQRFPAVEMALLRGADAVGAAKATRAGLKEGRIQVCGCGWGVGG
jgi:transcription-repair coupling factor (superfamily II helicase)